MTRPMPGPPEYWWYCTPPHGEPGLWTSDMDPAEYMPFTHLQHKHLTHVECAAHEWQADAELERAARNLDDDYYNPHRFRLRAEYERRLDEWDTWVEFTLRPHALEEA